MREAYYVELHADEIMAVVRTLEMNCRNMSDDTIIIDCIAMHSGGMIHDAQLKVKIFGADDKFLLYVNDLDSGEELGRITYQEWDIAHRACVRNYNDRRYLATVRLNYHV